MTAAAAAQAAGDFTWPDVAVIAVVALMVVLLTWLVMRS